MLTKNNLQRTLYKLLLGIGLIIHFGQAQAQNNDVAAAENLIKRILPSHYTSFKVAFIPQENNKDVFELESTNGKIILKGSNGVSVASALNFYLKNYTHCDIGWNGTNLKLPAKLPMVATKVKRTTPYQYRYYLNYCTFNYSMSWWNWERWEKEIDWMALNGINMPLAVLGQNSVWNRVYKTLGFTDKDLESFFSGPAYFNWFWMGNLDGWGGPLPQSFMQKQEVLQKQILARQRSLGMKPILPAFTGHVPPSFKDKFPDAKLKKTSWQGFSEVSILDPTDPMFITVGKKFIEEEIKTYGTDHFYTADTFNENTPPTNDSTFLSDVSKKVYQSMAIADPKATWIMQGWLFVYEAKFWQPTQIKALLNAVPNDKMIILDLFSENKPVWNRTNAYYGKPWIWCMLLNFGGNVSMYGRMNTVANVPAQTLKDPNSGNMLGLGLTPEAIEQNPVMYQLMLDNIWRNSPIELKSWLNDYAFRRYGKKDPRAEAAWAILHNTVYNGAITSGGPESIITGRPTLKPSTRWANTKKAYHPKDLIPAWDNLIAAANRLSNSEGYQYDIIDLTRQVMANYADTLQKAFAADYKRGDYQKFELHSRAFLEVINDVDELLNTHKDFLLGRWINSAKEMGNTPEEKALYEVNARNLITLWGDKNSVLNDYACKQWSGLLRDFYKPRWEAYFSFIKNSIDKSIPINDKQFTEQIKNWEWDWVHQHGSYNTVPLGNPIQSAIKFHKKYAPLIAAAATL